MPNTGSFSRTPPEHLSRPHPWWFHSGTTLSRFPKGCPMAASELQDLTADTAPASGDIVYVVVDPAGTPLARKMTVENLLKAVHLLSELTTSTTDTDKLLIGNSLEGTWAKYITPENLFKSIVALTEDTAPTTDDVVLTVNNPGGTAASRYATIANLMKAWFLDSEGNPADIGTAAGGSSTYAARRDHVHRPRGGWVGRGGPRARC